MTIFETHGPAAACNKARPALRNAVKSTLDRLSTALIVLTEWRCRARERRQLLGLSDRALADFGANRADAAGEGEKPFWQA
jgi:uncharacterized protein YjiS (DUF1127 family)